MPTVYDRETGLAQGLAVPEADRDVFKKPIYFSVKESVFAIPVKNEEGEDIGEEIAREQDLYKFSVYNEDLFQGSDSKMLGH